MKTKLTFFLVVGLLLVSGMANAAGYYVKTAATGDGSGISWDNAMSGTTFVSKLVVDFADNDVIYIAGGTYKPQTAASYFISIDKAITIIGGFNPDITGSTTDITYPSTTPTIFSGDVNNNGIADSGDSPVAYISNDVTLKGITVTNGYTETAERPGIHLNAGNLNLYYCTIDGNVSATTASGDAGGSGLFLNGGTTIYAYKTVISNNTADNRGGAIRLTDTNGTVPSSLTLESCLVAGNSISGNYGGAIQVSGAENTIYSVNTTIANNTAAQHGAGINSNGYIYLISSTLVNNAALGQGQDIRCESSEKIHIVNSIITGDNGDVPRIYLNGNNRKIESDGFNIFGNIGKSSDGSIFTTQSTDFTDIYYADLFGTNALADNDGYPQTIALTNAYAVGATIAQLNQFKTNYTLSVGDVSKDQRGFSRNATAAVSIGAYEYGASKPSAINTVQVDKYLIYPTKVENNLTIAGAEGATISIVNISGIAFYSRQMLKTLNMFPWEIIQKEFI